MNYKNKISTPILAAVRAMHAAEDLGRDPYNSMRSRTPIIVRVSEEQRREAEGILACYETELQVQP